MKNKIELLAPAGNIESFKAACCGGADAIYMGIDRFNARAMAKNFSIEEYIECINEAHFRGIKVYLTLNTLVKDEEINEALNVICRLYASGLDAVIVQDLGLSHIIHKLLPDLPLHASTQMSIYSIEQIRVLEKLGFKRVVLARELTLEEIENIKKNTTLEIEVFVHGALCVSLSGQCLLSQVIGGRSANRGECAQPCRMKYTLFNNSGKEIIKSKYILSKKDIYGLEHLKKLKKIGVDSLKIEGRNKTPEYVYGVVSTYRKYIDNIQTVNETDKYVLKQLFNRNGMSDGYLEKVRFKESISEMSPKNTGLYLGKVIKTYKKFIKIKLEEDIDLHDGIEIYSNGKIVSNIVTCIKDENGNILNNKVEKGNYVYLGDFKEKVDISSSVYKTSSNKLNSKLKNSYINGKRRKKFNISVNILLNKKISVMIDELNLYVETDYIPQLAKKRALTPEDINEIFSKTNDEPFELNVKYINLDDNLFAPTSILNELRRNVISKMKEYYSVNLDMTEIKNKEASIMDDLNKEIEINNLTSNSNLKSLFIYRYDKNIDYINYYNDKYGTLPDLMYFNFSSFIKNKEDILYKYKNKTKIFLALPNFVLEKQDKIIRDSLEEYIKFGVNGLLISSFDYLEQAIKLKEKYNIELVADYSFNVTNIYSAYVLKKLGFDRVTLSVELENFEMLNISKKIQTEVVTDIITVMTSRYCILGSFIENRTDINKKCSMPCKDIYYLEDIHKARYYIICDSIDCIMKILKYRKKAELNNGKLNIRHCII